MPSLTLPQNRLRFAALALALTAGLTLACGGMSVDPGTQMEPVCKLSGKVNITGDLVQLDAPVVELPEGIQLQVNTEGMFVGWTQTTDAAELTEKLREEAEVAGMLTVHTGGGPTQVPLLVMISPEVPASRVGEVLRAAHAAGLASINLIVWSKTPVDLPPYPDPAYAEELKGRLALVASEDRQRIAAKEISGLITLCPGMQRAFEAVAYAAPDQRCALITAGMAEALPTCIATDGDKVLTAMQIISEPPGDFVPTAVHVQLDPEATPVEAAGTWADLAPKLAAKKGEKVWMP
jgi:hypothetical protein